MFVSTGPVVAPTCLSYHLHAYPNQSPASSIGTLATDCSGGVYGYRHDVSAFEEFEVLFAGDVPV